MPHLERAELHSRLASQPLLARLLAAKLVNFLTAFNRVYL